MNPNPSENGAGQSLNEPEDTLASIYNPAASKDGPPAKLWELLRRNPAFRQDAAWVVEHGDQPKEQRQIVNLIDSGLSDHCCFSRPFAALVLRWLGEPFFAEPMQIVNLLFGSESCADHLGAYVFGGTMSSCDDEWQAYRQSDPAQFMKGYPFYLLSTPQLGIGEHSELIRRLILPAFLRNDYTGPLRISGGTSNLDTPWPKMPALFQQHFRWLWAHYDANQVNPYTGDRKLLPRPAVLSSAQDYSRDEQLGMPYPRLAGEFMFMVPVCFHTEQSIKNVYSSFQSALRQRFERMQILEQKYQYLFGTETEWELFAFVRDRIDYSALQEREPLFRVPTPYNSSGRGRAFEVYERAKKRRKDWSQTSKVTGHIERRYDDMERLMMGLYPGIEFHRIVNDIYPGWPEKRSPSTRMTSRLPMKRPRSTRPVD